MIVRCRCVVVSLCVLQHEVNMECTGKLLSPISTDVCLVTQSISWSSGSCCRACQKWTRLGGRRQELFQTTRLHGAVARRWSCVAKTDQQQGVLKQQILVFLLFSPLRLSIVKERTNIEWLGDHTAVRVTGFHVRKVRTRVRTVEKHDTTFWHSALTHLFVTEHGQDSSGVGKMSSQNNPSQLHTTL